MKTLLPYKPTRVLSNYIHEEGQIIDTPLDISNKFNNHFCRVGKALPEKIKPSNLNNFQHYLCNRVCSSMFLNPTSAFEIHCIINQLNINKSCGSDGVEAKFIPLASEFCLQCWLYYLMLVLISEFFLPVLKQLKLFLYIRLEIKMK